MIFEDLIKNIDHLDYEKNSDREVLGVSSDSRKIQEGYAFVAFPGREADGHDYIGRAIEKGACTIVYSRENLEKSPEINYIRVEDGRRAFAQISNLLSGYPSKKIPLVGVTGSNGKTTTSTVIYFLLRELGKKALLIGTEGAEFEGKKVPSSNTTPEIDEINSLLNRGLEAGADVAVLETSSHGLFQKRTYGLDFDYGVFTNLSREHLDFHKTMENYFKAKMILLEGSRVKIANLDDDYGKRAKDLFPDALGFSIDAPSAYRAEEVTFRDMGYDFKIKGEDFRLNRLTKYDIYNSLPGIIIAERMGYPLAEISKALAKFKGVPARFEFIENDLDRFIVLDFAHTEVAFDDIFKSVPKGHRIIAVYGLNGDRDRDTRIEVGRAAGRNGVHSILTTDDLKFSTFEDVTSDLAEGIKREGGTYEVVEKREDAIEYGLKISKPGDFIFVLGKGDEDFQKFDGNKKVPYNERAAIAAAIEAFKRG